MSDEVPFVVDAGLAGGTLKMGSDLAMARVAGWQLAGGEWVFVDTRGSREYASLVQQAFGVVERGDTWSGSGPAEAGFCQFCLWGEAG
jgi:hypothetical protein